MDEFLTLVGAQAMRYAIRSSIALSSKYAISQCSRLLKSVGDEDALAELKALQELLESKIKVISPAFDLIEFKCGRGNIFLDSALPLIQALQQEITLLGTRIELIASRRELQTADVTDHAPRTTRSQAHGVAFVIKDIKVLLERIDREIPLLQLAITASGESLSTSLPPTISPSRLLQASTLLTIGDTQYAQHSSQTIQIGPAFHLSLYMLFVGHASHIPQNVNRNDDYKGKRSHVTYGLGVDERKPIWQEVMHKARVRLCRTAQPVAVEVAEHDTWCPLYSYHLELIEDLDDGRLHSESLSDQASTSGLKERIPIFQISKIFYTDSGRLLNIGSDTDDGKKPILLLKRDTHASAFSHHARSKPGILQDTVDKQKNIQLSDERVIGQADIDRQLFGKYLPDSKLPQVPNAGADRSALPKHLDPEWLAFEMFEDDEDTTSTSEDSLNNGDTISMSCPSPAHNYAAVDAELERQIKNLSVLGASSQETSAQPSPVSQCFKANGITKKDPFVSRSPFDAITTSLSLVEMLIRLASLQEFQQASHLSIPDHILSFFLEETSTTGLVGDAQWKARSQAKSRVGFDPYMDGPVS